ncbi:MAG: 5'-deoxynucleotidase [Oscillospiraceae bacterium]|nr:5'-deoxynucleotidase [Oscillospiraceae bacterium]
MEMFNFNALLARLKYIPRWSLMRQNVEEDLAQHTSEVALMAHTLCLLANNKFGKTVDCEKVAVAALYHDVSEILTGDMPTPVKYNNPQIMAAYKAVEKHAVNKLLETSHPDIRDSLRPYLTQDSLTEYEKKLLKAADKICALTKCIEELHSGNKEFESAYKTTYQSLVEMDMEEINFFIENMLAGFSLCLDELAKI